MQAFDQLQRESQHLFDTHLFGYDLVIGPAGSSPLGLVLVADYGGHQTRGLVSYSLYADLSRRTAPLPQHADYRRYVKWAIPLVLADSYKGRRVVGTSPQMFGFDDDGTAIQDGAFQHHKGHSYILAKGRIFALRKFEAVIGSEVADKEHFDLGGTFRVTHGFPAQGDTPDIHKSQWTIVGILQPTGTVADRDLFVPVISFYAIAEHERGLIEQALMRAEIDPAKIAPDRLDSVLSSVGLDVRWFPPSLRKRYNITLPTTPGAQPSKNTGPGELLRDANTTPPDAKEAGEEDPDPFMLDATGNIVPDLPPAIWQLSAILIEAQNPFSTEMLKYKFMIGNLPVSAVKPAGTARESLDELRSSRRLLDRVTW